MTEKSPFVDRQPRRGVFAESNRKGKRPTKAPLMREVPDDYVALYGVMIRRSEKAVRFKPTRGPEQTHRCRELWVPFSEIHETTLLGNDVARLVVPEWLYQKHRVRRPRPK